MNEPLIPLFHSELPEELFFSENRTANFLYLALPLSAGVDLPATHAVPIIVGVVSVLIPLIYQGRRLSFRELLSVMVLRLVSSTKIGAAEVNSSRCWTGLLSDAAFDVNALDTGSGNMETSVRLLLATIGEIYGVEPSSFYEWEKRSSQSSAVSGLQEGSEYDSVSSIAERAFRHVVLDR